MKAHPRVIGYLQRALNHEFNAVQQYTMQAAQADSLGIGDFASELREGVQEELRHAEAFLRQMYAVGAIPRAGQTRAPHVGRNRAEMLQAALQTEQDAIRLYREAGQFCLHIGDEPNFLIFSGILDDEIEHEQQLERQLSALQGTR